ncbi:hypothetical protein BDQ94DRAFT_153969 [Aspergillus welwitschiae]|uniref:Uncharacterized protein n=1 Tax=Aspergillus welwitschiae TaxID=1341132 RepID=A0A3F3PKF5_9EURO|nr:hypothetical protein BDQ94DRAFT_153969 [Aspergillus welwitschiae]RDH27401.1 hypothetical protein BDQ94DRAFT_153969 [Aspergillus welwitschiae]
MHSFRRDLRIRRIASGPLSLFIAHLKSASGRSVSHVERLFMESGLELNSYSSKTCANVLSLRVLLVTLSNNVVI